MQLIGLYLEWQDNFKKWYFVWTFSSADFHLLELWYAYLILRRVQEKLWNSVSDAWVFCWRIGNPNFTEVSSETLTEVSEVKIFTTVF